MVRRVDRPCLPRSVGKLGDDKPAQPRVARCRNGLSGVPTGQRASPAYRPSRGAGRDLAARVRRAARRSRTELDQLAGLRLCPVVVDSRWALRVVGVSVWCGCQNEAVVERLYERRGELGERSGEAVWQTLRALESWIKPL